MRSFGFKARVRFRFRFRVRFRYRFRYRVRCRYRVRFRVQSTPSDSMPMHRGLLSCNGSTSETIARQYVPRHQEYSP